MRGGLFSGGAFKDNSIRENVCSGDAFKDQSFGGDEFSGRALKGLAEVLARIRHAGRICLAAEVHSRMRHSGRMCLAEVLARKSHAGEIVQRRRFQG